MIKINFLTNLFRKNIFLFVVLIASGLSSVTHAKDATKADVYLLRDSLHGLFISFHLSINDVKVASLSPYSFVHLEVEPGEYKISADRGLDKDGLKISASAGQSIYIRVEGLGLPPPNPKLTILEKIEGAGAIKNCKMTVFNLEFLAGGALKTVKPVLAEDVKVASSLQTVKIENSIDLRPDDKKLNANQVVLTEIIRSDHESSLEKPQLVQANQVSEQPSSLGSPLVTLSRKALVIGNDAYQSVARLLNAREDARTIASKLSDLGYQVTLKLDLNEKQMKAALRTFASQVQGGDEVMFFFAGHGVQLGAANYLLPTDIVGDSEAQVRDEAIQLQRVLDDMSDKKAKFTLAMIDACRDNPFKSSGRAVGGRGLAPTSAATGQMVVFSAGTGQQALDRLGPTDKHKNGLFTRIFVQEMQKPNVSVDRVVKNVRSQVAELAKSVGHEQVPAIYDQVLGDFYFVKK